LSILLSKEDALQGLIFNFKLRVDISYIIQGLLDGTTLAPSQDWPAVKIGPFLGRLSSKPKDLSIAILSLFLKDSHCESSGSPGRVLGEYLRGQCDGWKVVDHRISFDFGGSSHLNYRESFQAFIKNIVPDRFVFIYIRSPISQLPNRSCCSFLVISIATNSIRDGKCVLSNPLGITIHGSLSEVLTNYLTTMIAHHWSELSPLLLAFACPSPH
jgi:hypothetical protein